MLPAPRASPALAPAVTDDATNVVKGPVVRNGASLGVLGTGRRITASGQIAVPRTRVWRTHGAIVNACAGGAVGMERSMAAGTSGADCGREGRRC